MGLNVASDPFVTAVYTEVNGGLVVVSADDPGMHSSQNEQDNRHYAQLSHAPMFELSDPQEAYLMIKEAFEVSERFDIPILFRTSTRVAQSRQNTMQGIGKDERGYPYLKDVDVCIRCFCCHELFTYNVVILNYPWLLKVLSR